MKCRIPYLVLVGALSFVAPVFAQQTETPKIEVVKQGELRLDGKIVLMAGKNEWQIQALSWTSPAGNTIEFAEPKDKMVVFNDKTFIHPRGEEDTVPLSEIKVGNRVAIIGKNQPNGTVLAREIVMLEGFGKRKSVGSLRTNPVTWRFVEQSRAAREMGQLPKAKSLIEQAISAAQGTRDLSGEALATQDLALLYLDLEQPDKALQAFQREVALGEALGNGMVQILGLTGQAKVLAGADQMETAIGLAEQANRISSSLEPKIRLSAMTLLASLYLSEKRVDDAIGILTALHPVEDAAGQSDDALGTILQLALIQARTDERFARELLEKAKLRVTAIRNPQYKPGLLTQYGAALYLLGSQEEAQEQWKQAAALHQAAGKTSEAEKLRGLPQRIDAMGKGQLAIFSALAGEQMPALPPVETPAP